jgi:PAS domain S-box-containing protein
MSTSSLLTGVARNGLAWQLLQAMPEATFLVDRESLAILATNPSGEKLTERSSDDLIDLPFVEIFVRIDGGDIAAAINSDQSVLTPSEFEIRMRSDQAPVQPMVARYQLLDCDEQTIWLVTVGPTRATRQSTDTAFRIGNVQYSAPSAGHIASIRCARDGAIVQCSESISELFELPGDSEFTVETLLQRVTPADGDAVRERWSQFLTDGKPYETRFRINHQSGELKHVTWAARIESNDSDDSVLVLIHDDTELVRLKTLENEHHSSIAKLEEIVLSIEGFAWESEASTGAFTYVSSRAEEIFGYSESQWIEDPGFFPSVIHPEERDAILSFCLAETKDGTDHAMTYRMIAADGSIRWVRDIVYLARNDAGVVTHLRGLIIDITDEHHLRDQLAESERRFRRLFDESPTALIELDWSDVRHRLQELQDSGVSDIRTWLTEHPEEVFELSRLGCITAVNRSALELFEASSIDDFNGHVRSIMREDSMPALREHLLFRLSGERTFESDNVNYTFFGKRIDVHFTVTAAAGAEESWSRLYSSLVNVTPQRQAKILRDGQSQVLESLAANNSVENVLSTLATELERQSPDIRTTVFRTSSARSTLQKIANAGVAEEIVTLIDSIRIDDLYGHNCEHADIRLASTNRDGVRKDPERTIPTISEIISRAIGSCGYHCGVLKPAIGPDNQLLGVLTVFHTTSNEFTTHEEDVVNNFSDLTGLVLQHDQRQRVLTLRTDELHSLFESYPDALLRIAPDGTIVDRYSGTQLTEFLHLSEEPSGQILWHLLPQQDAGLIRTAIENVTVGKQQESIHFSVQHDRERRDFEARFLPLPSTDEQIAILRDVTQLKLAELKLEHASEQFRYLFENSPDAIFVESPGGMVLDANQTACDLHKLSRDQLIGQDVLSLVPPRSFHPVGCTGDWRSF